MERRTKILFGVIGAVFLVMVGLTLWKQAQPVIELEKFFSYDEIKIMADEIDYDKYDINNVVEVDGFWENIKGNPNAPVKIYEYADFQCSHCAEINSYLNKLVDEYDGKVAVVFRTYVLNYNENGTLAAQAVNAAAKQGYFAEMKDILFENQGTWFYMNAEKFREKLGEYFLIASERKGDREKFFEDLGSEEVARKVAFDMGAGAEIGLKGTPWFLVNGEWFENKGVSATRYIAQLREKINEELKK